MSIAEPTTTYRSITVRPIAGALGAEIGGVDLSTELDDAVIAEIRQAWLDHLVIFFRDQPISDASFLAIIVSAATANNSRISSDLGLVSSKALQALVMKLRIGDRAALLTHTRLAERRVCLEQPVVLFALRHVALWRPGW